VATVVAQRRAIVIVLDGLGAGDGPDAARFGDQGSATLQHLAAAVGGLDVPNLAALGLGNLLDLPGVARTDAPAGAYGLMIERSAAKASLTGHWEMMGLISPDLLPTYPDGFPPAIIERFERETGRAVIGNKPASGLHIIDELGPEHDHSGAWILYTSADSVFQVASNTRHVPLQELYTACTLAHTMLTGEGELLAERVIARPFHGTPGAYVREEENRHDYGIAPPRDTYLDAFKAAGHAVIAVGKPFDIFSGQGFTGHDPGKPDDAAKLDAILRALASLDGSGLIFANLVDFDSKFGHRRNAPGMAENLARFDARLPELLGALGSDDLLLITADHGNDPTFRGSDHTRERVPLLVHGGGARGDLGVRDSFCDVGATVADWLGVDSGDLPGVSVLRS
jgi:phosphopentomutase